MYYPGNKLRALGSSDAILGSFHSVAKIWQPFAQTVLVKHRCQQFRATLFTQSCPSTRLENTYLHPAITFERRGTEAFDLTLRNKVIIESMHRHCRQDRCYFMGCVAMRLIGEHGK